MQIAVVWTTQHINSGCKGPLFSVCCDQEEVCSSWKENYEQTSRNGNRFSGNLSGLSPSTSVLHQLNGHVIHVAIASIGTVGPQAAEQNIVLVIIVTIIIRPIIIIILLSNAKVSFWCAKYRLKVAQRVKEPKSRSTLCSPIQHSLVP